MPQLLMAFNREAIDQTRKLQNLPPISDEEFASLNGNGQNDEEKLALLKAEEDKKKLADDAEVERLRLLAEDEKNNPKPTPEKIELSEAEEMEIVAKRTGRKITSWDDLKPAAEVLDKEKAREERDTEKFIWGLRNKQFTKKEQENFIADSKDPKDLVYRQRLQAALKDDPKLDEKEFQSEFDEEFGLDVQDKTSRRYKNGQDTLNRLANEILRTNYAPIYELENKYSQFENQTQIQLAQEQKVKEGAPAYKKTLDTVKVKLKKIKAHLGDTDSYEVELLDENIENVITMMSDPAWASAQILKGYTEDQLTDIAYTTVLKENFPFIANEIKKQALLKHAAGTKGVLRIDSNVTEDDYQLTDEQKKLKSIIEQNTPASAGALN